MNLIKLISPKRNIPILREDYEHMQNMIFGDVPDFDDILKGIEQLQKEINSIQDTNKNN